MHLPVVRVEAAGRVPHLPRDDRLLEAVQCSHLTDHGRGRPAAVRDWCWIRSMITRRSMEGARSAASPCRGRSCVLERQARANVSWTASSTSPPAKSDRRANPNISPPMATNASRSTSSVIRPASTSVPGIHFRNGLRIPARSPDHHPPRRGRGEAPGRGTWCGTRCPGATPARLGGHPRPTRLRPHLTKLRSAGANPPEGSPQGEEQCGGPTGGWRSRPGAARSRSRG